MNPERIRVRIMRGSCASQTRWQAVTSGPHGLWWGWAATPCRAAFLAAAAYRHAAIRDRAVVA